MAVLDSNCALGNELLKFISKVADHVLSGKFVGLGLAKSLVPAQEDYDKMSSVLLAEFFLSVVAKHRGLCPSRTLSTQIESTKLNQSFSLRTPIVD